MNARNLGIWGAVWHAARGAATTPTGAPSETNVDYPTPTGDPLIVRQWCPDCEPDAGAGEALDNAWELCYCWRHVPSSAGPDDSGSVSIPYLDAGGDPNRAICDFIHRRPSEDPQ